MKEVGLNKFDRATMACALDMFEEALKERADELAQDNILAFIVGLASIEKIRRAFDLKELSDEIQKFGSDLGIE